MAYVAQMSLVLLICSGIFWGLASAAIAVSSNLNNPLKHLVTGACLQAIGFIIVALLCIAAKRKTKRAHTALQNQYSIQSPQVEEW